MKSPSVIHRIKFYLEFYSKIPERKWCIGRYYGVGSACAIGHLTWLPDPGSHMNELNTLLQPVMVKVQGAPRVVPAINDGTENFSTLGNHPKKRMMTALQMRLEMETNEPTDCTPDKTLP